MTFKKIYAAIIVFLCAGLAHSSFAQVKDADTKASIAGKTYQGWTAGKFDYYTDAVAGSKVVFDKASGATIRQLVCYTNGDVPGSQQIITATYTLINNRPALAFKSSGGDAGSAYITSYDKGAKIWVESTDQNRLMKGWLLLIPAAPTR